MRTGAFAVLTALLVCASFQALTVYDVKQIGNTADFLDAGNTNIQVFDDGTKYVSGTFIGSVTINGQGYTATGSNFMLIKYNPAGAIVFVKHVPINGLSKGSVASDGSFYVFAKGFPQATVDGVTIPGANIALLKFSSTGTLEWHKYATTYTLPMNIHAASDNGVVLVTQDVGTSTWSDGTVINQAVGVNNEMTLIKFSATGAKLWHNRVSRPAWDNSMYGNGIKIRNGYIYNVAFTRRNLIGWNSVVDKVSEAGVISWSVTESSSDHSNAQVQAIDVDANDNVYLSGITQRTTYFESKDNLNVQITTGTVWRVFLVKYTPVGNIQWVKATQPSAGQETIATTVAVNGNYVLITGYSTAGFTYDGTAVAKTGSTNNGFILSIDATSGALVQSNFITSSDINIMAVTKSGSYFTVGTTIRGAITIGTTTITPVNTASVALFNFGEFSCSEFDTSRYGAKTPAVTATASGNQVTITVKMPRNSLDNSVVPVYHDIDTLAATPVCRTAPEGATPYIKKSAGISWIKSTEGCLDTYTITQSLSNIIDSADNNNWATSIIQEGKAIEYKLPILMTYSVNPSAGCYYVGYKSVITFRSQLVVGSTSEFYTADSSAKFALSGVRVTAGSTFEVKGSVTPLVPKSNFRGIYLKKYENYDGSAADITFDPVPFDCDDKYAGATPGSCAALFTKDISLLGNVNANIGGRYKVVGNVEENGVATRTNQEMTFQLSYVIPADPTVVDSTQIETSLAFYTSDEFTQLRSATAFNTRTDTLYIENKKSSGPVIPSDYRLRLNTGYLCCVNYLGNIGTCSDPTGKLQAATFSSEGSAGVTMLDADTGDLRYTLKIELDEVMSASVASRPSMTCQVVLESKFETGARNKNGQSLDAVYVSTIPFSVEEGKIVSSATTATIAILSLIVLALTL